MPLRVARPWKDPKTGVFHLRQRTPRDILPSLRGQSVTLPVGRLRISVTVGVIVQVSLRTKEPSQARIWHSVADGALKLIWQARRNESDRSAPTDAPVMIKEPVTQAALAVEACPEHRPPELAPAGNEPNAGTVTAGTLFERWSAYSEDKKAPNTIKRYRGSFRSFEAFTKGRDVRTLTADDLYAWAEHRRDVEGVTARAINKNDMVAVGSVMGWAASRQGKKLLSDNPVRGVRLDEPRRVVERERTFREQEVAAILSAASAVKPDEENPTFAAARRWCPWLAAYSGARIAELTHLEKRDIRTEAGIVVMDLRVTKTGEPRTVPLHAHLIELGLLAFVAASAPGPLFYDPKRHGKASSTSPAELRGHKVGKWVRATVNLDPGVDPNHGWRHTFKPRALGAGIEERLRDAITGHRVASVGRRYETPSLSMLSRAIEHFPRYNV